MLLCIILKIKPEFVRESILRIRILFQDVLHAGARHNWPDVKLEINCPTVPLPVKPNEENSFTVLRDKVLAIDYLKEHLVIKFFKGIPNDTEGIALVMTAKVLYVLQEKCLRATTLENCADIEEERALRFILKSRLAP